MSPRHLQTDAPILTAMVAMVGILVLVVAGCQSASPSGQVGTVAGPEAVELPQTSGCRHIRKKLAQHSAVRFEQTPLIQVLDVYRRTLDADFVVNWAALEQAGIGAQQRVTYSDSATHTLGDSLTACLRQASSHTGHELTYRVVRGSICISAQPATSGPASVAIRDQVIHGADSKLPQMASAGAAKMPHVPAPTPSVANLPTGSAGAVQHLLNRAAVLYANGDVTQARQLIDEALRLNPEHPAARSIQAFLLGDRPATGLAAYP